MFEKITIIGCGLIGSSILRNINNNEISKTITVFDKSKDVIETIKKENLCSNVSKDIKSAVKDSDLIILAIPLSSYKEVLLSAKDIFKKSRENSPNEKMIVEEFNNKLGLSLSLIINIIDPDAIVFGGGVSNEIDFLHEVDSLVRKFVIGREYEGVFLKPKFGDASGVRGAARLGRSTTY